MASKFKESDVDSEGCEVMEIIQFMCNFQVVDDKKSKLERPSSTPNPTQLQCVPYPRIFRICPNRPATEITRYIDVDTETGEIEVSARSRYAVPKGKLWWDVQQHDQEP